MEGTRRKKGAILVVTATPGFMPRSSIEAGAFCVNIIPVRTSQSEGLSMV